MDIRTFIIYIGVLGIISLIAKNAERNDNTLRARIGCMTIVIVLSLLLGCRNISVGIDTNVYARMFEVKGNVNWVEIGFAYLVKALMSIRPTYTFGFWSIGFITNLFFILGLWNYRDIAKFKYTIPIYYILIFFSTMSGIRQWLAVSIVFYFSKYVLNEKTNLIKFIVALVVATSIHNSAIVGLLLITPLILKKATTWYSTAFKMLLIMALPVASMYSSRMVLSKYGAYLDGYSSTTSIGVMIPVRLALMCLIFIFEHQRQATLGEAKKQPSLGVLAFIELVALLLTSTGYFMRNVGRIGWIFTSFTPVFYGMTMTARTTKKSIVRLLKYLIIVIVLYYLFGILTSKTSMIVPYKFYWE